MLGDLGLCARSSSKFTVWPSSPPRSWGEGGRVRRLEESNFWYLGRRRERKGDTRTTRTKSQSPRPGLSECVGLEVSQGFLFYPYVFKSCIMKTTTQTLAVKIRPERSCFGTQT